MEGPGGVEDERPVAGVEGVGDRDDDLLQAGGQAAHPHPLHSLPHHRHNTRIPVYCHTTNAQLVSQPQPQTRPLKIQQKQ